MHYEVSYGSIVIYSGETIDTAVEIQTFSEVEGWGLTPSMKTSASLYLVTRIRVYLKHRRIFSVA
jgi:hypothetical protein